MMRLLLLALFACAPRSSQPAPQHASHDAKAGAPVRLVASTVEPGKNQVVIEALGPIDTLDAIARIGADELARKTWTDPLKAGDQVTLLVDVPRTGTTPLVSISVRASMSGAVETRVMALDVEGMRVENAGQAPVRRDPYGREIRPAE